jgi:hypothetical protein
MTGADVRAHCQRHPGGGAAAFSRSLPSVLCSQPSHDVSEIHSSRIEEAWRVLVRLSLSKAAIYSISQSRKCSRIPVMHWSSTNEGPSCYLPFGTKLPPPLQWPLMRYQPPYLPYSYLVTSLWRILTGRARDRIDAIYWWIQNLSDGIRTLQLINALNPLVCFASSSTSTAQHSEILGDEGKSKILLPVRGQGLRVRR